MVVFKVLQTKLYDQIICDSYKQRQCTVSLSAAGGLVHVGLGMCIKNDVLQHFSYYFTDAAEKFMQGLLG